MKHELKLYDSIGEYGITAKEFTDGIPEDATDITVRINSLGGSVPDGLAMYNYLRDHPATVTTVVDGYAASAASLVMLAGDVRQVHSGSIVMVHNPWTMTAGNADELRKTAETLDEVGEAMMAIYEQRTGQTRADLDVLFKAETYMRGEVAAERGFADQVIDDSNEAQGMAAFAGWASLVQTLQKGDECMSTTKTRKDVIAERDALQEQATADGVAKAEMQAKIDELTAAAEASVEARDTLIAEHAAAIEAKDAEIAAVNAKVDAIAQERDETQAALDDEKAEHVKTGDALAKIKDAAANNPALVHAAMGEIDGKTAVSVHDAEADEAEAKAKAEAEKVKAEPKTYSEAYFAMPQGAARLEYFRAHKKEIMNDAPLPSEEG
jgi:ATP-dependent protease ClpP protease subunit